MDRMDRAARCVFVNLVNSVSYSLRPWAAGQHVFRVRAACARGVFVAGHVESIHLFMRFPLPAATLRPFSGGNCVYRREQQEHGAPLV